MAVTTRAPIIGVRNLKYALITGGDTSTSVPPTYGPVKDLAATAQFGFDPAFSQTTGYYSDAPMYVFTSHGEMSFNMSGDDILPEVEAELCGQAYVNGILADNIGDTPPYVAIGGIFARSDGSREYFWFPKVQFAKGSVTVDTKGVSTSTQNTSMSGRVIPLTYNAQFRTRVRSSDTAKNATVFNNWFNAPVITGSADLGAVTVTAAAGTSGQIVFTFAKAGGANANINSASITSATVSVVLTSGYVVQVPTAYNLAAVSGTTQTLTVTGLTAGASTYLVQGVTDVNGVTCTSKAGTVTVV